MSKRTGPTMKRTEAARLIDNIREAVTNEDATAALNLIRRHFKDAGIPDLVPCDGEAHSNPHIDNCGQCMPRWGLVGAPVVVR